MRDKLEQSRIGCWWLVAYGILGWISDTVVGFVEVHLTETYEFIQLWNYYDVWWDESSAIFILVPYTETPVVSVKTDWSSSESILSFHSASHLVPLTLDLQLKPTKLGGIVMQ